MADGAARVANWKIITAALLDFFTMFFAGGFLVGAMTGGLTENGFKLEGWPGALLLALIVAYFVIGNRTGGTLWKRIFGIISR